MWAAIAAFLQALFGALFSALRTRRQDQERDSAIRGDAVGNAAAETDEAINETADARSSVPTSPVDLDALIDELRREQSAEGARSRPAARRRRPF